jgi:hypothetical protein
MASAALGMAASGTQESRLKMFRLMITPPTHLARSMRCAAILAALVTTACSGGTVSSSAVPSSPAEATASPTASPTAVPTAVTGTTFRSSIYPYTMQLPSGWQAHVGEDVFDGPDDMTLTIGTGQPEPGQTVEDRVAANRESEFADCTTDPADDAPITLGGEPGILWSMQCGPTLGLAANTIHHGLGYRLLLQLPDGAEAMARATAMMDGFLASFAFTD